MTVFLFEDDVAVVAAVDAVSNSCSFLRPSHILSHFFKSDSLLGANKEGSEFENF
jgi:hypothetical protein